MDYICLDGPFGYLTVFAENDQITVLEFGRAPDPVETPLLRTARDQLAAYLQGKLTNFDLPLAPAGTPFQQRVWDAMRRIPFGATRRYGDLAQELNSAARAVGGACGANPIPILIPCHRVLAAGGRLGGYSGGDGLPTKAALLRLEGLSI
ncbi:MAG: methylated-DNA--[protein]-cysteine S-methyltransferase [Magnetospiraceae bacterium]